MREFEEEKKQMVERDNEERKRLKENPVEMKEQTASGRSIFLMRKRGGRRWFFKVLRCVCVRMHGAASHAVD